MGKVIKVTSSKHGEFNLKEFHEYFEGVSKEAYKDSGGVITIGIGHTNGMRTAKVQMGDKWSEDTINEVYALDIAKAYRTAQSWIDYSQVPYELQIALAELAFNVGQRPHTMIKHIERGDYLKAKRELLRWVYCRSKVLLGLVKRRLAMYKFTVGDDWREGNYLLAGSKDKQSLREELKRYSFDIAI